MIATDDQDLLDLDVRQLEMTSTAPEAPAQAAQAAQAALPRTLTLCAIC